MKAKRVSFESADERVVGDLYQPDGEAVGIVVLTGPATSVKEQVTGVYARSLAERGFAALTFDHRYFGESEGEPRQFENPKAKVEDISAAISFLQSEPAMNDLPIHGLGICAGGGYMAAAAMADARLERFAGVAGFYPEAGVGEDAQRAVAAGDAARDAFERGEPALHIPAVAPSGDRAMPLDDALAYYGDPDRGGVPNYTNSYAVQSKAETTPFDILNRVGGLHQPALVVHSEGALTPGYARRFFEALPGSKRELWIEEADRQTRFYDDPKIVAKAADAVADHFAEGI